MCSVGDSDLIVCTMWVRGEGGCMYSQLSSMLHISLYDAEVFSVPMQNIRNKIESYDRT